MPVLYNSNDLEDILCSIPGSFCVEIVLPNGSTLNYTNASVLPFELIGTLVDHVNADLENMVIHIFLEKPVQLVICA